LSRRDEHLIQRGEVGFHARHDDVRIRAVL
jgi:hypothetical protein